MHHHFVFALTNQMVFHAALAAPPAASDYMTNMQWASETNLFAIEGLAEIMGVDELDTVDVPEPRDSPVANAHEHLVRSLRNLDLADEYERHQLRIAFRLARHLQRYDEIGDACTEADLDDLRQFLGRADRRRGRRATPRWRSSCWPTAARTTRSCCSSSTVGTSATRCCAAPRVRPWRGTNPSRSSVADRSPRTFLSSSHVVHTEA